MKLVFVVEHVGGTTRFSLDVDPDELLCDVLNRREVQIVVGRQAIRCFDVLRRVFDQSRTLRAQGIEDGTILVLVPTLNVQFDQVTMHDARRSSMQSGEVGFVSPAGGGVVPHQQLSPPGGVGKIIVE